MPIVNSYPSLANLKSSTASGAAFLVGASGVSDGAFVFTIGDFTGKADDVNIVKADPAMLSTGAWVRQQNVDLQASDIALSVAAAAANSGAVQLGKGEFLGTSLADRKTGIRGTGMLTTMATPPTTTGVALRGLFSLGTWDTPAFTDLGFVGSGVKQGTGFRFGPDSYSAGAEYNGRGVRATSHSFSRGRWALVLRHIAACIYSESPLAKVRTAQSGCRANHPNSGSSTITRTNGNFGATPRLSERRL